MTGNCLGWVVYGYYTNDPFVVAGNVPGLILSLWLNTGAAKLQYLAQVQQQQHDKDPIHTEMIPPSIPNVTSTSAPTRSQQEEERWDASSPQSFSTPHHRRRRRRRLMTGPGLLGRISRYNPTSDSTTTDHEDDGSVEDGVEVTLDSQEAMEYLVMVPQERSLLRLLVIWTIVIVYVGWFLPSSSSRWASAIVGIVVNLNLIFFYGAPLQTMRTVVATKCSDSIHVPTMFMNLTNTSFWIAYALTRRDVVILLPNMIGLSLGLIQGLLCFWYPRTSAGGSHQLVASDDVEFSEELGPSRRPHLPPEEDVPPLPPATPSSEGLGVRQVV